MEDSLDPPLGSPVCPIPSCYMLDGRWLRVHLHPHCPAAWQEALTNASHLTMTLSCQCFNSAGPHSLNFLKNCFRMLSTANHYSWVVGMVFVTFKLTLNCPKQNVRNLFTKESKEYICSPNIRTLIYKSKKKCKSHFPSPGNQDLAGYSHNLCLGSGP